MLDLPEPLALDNVNTRRNTPPRSATLSAGPAAAALPRQVNVRYFALLREQAGRGGEALQTDARTPRRAVSAQLRRERGLKLAPELLRVAINEEFGDWQQPLR